MIPLPFWPLMPSQSPGRSSVESDTGVFLNEIFIFSESSKLRRDLMSPRSSVDMPKLDTPEQTPPADVGHIGQPTKFLFDFSLKLLSQPLNLADLKEVLYLDLGGKSSSADSRMRLVSETVDELRAISSH